MTFFRSIHLRQHSHTLTAVAFICVLVVFSFFHTFNAYAAQNDLTCQQVNSGVDCKQFQDEAGVSIWCNSYSNSSLLHNTYMQMCVRSLVFSGTGDGKRYALFNIQEVSNPDALNRVNDSWNVSADSSGSGTNSTMEARLWSLGRSNCNNACDQENYDGLEPSNNCSPTGGTISIGLSSDLGHGGFSWTETDPLYYGCTYVPPSDIYSQYYDYTMEDVHQVWTKLKSDFTFAQWAPNGFNNSWIEIGLSAKAQFGYVSASNGYGYYTWLNSGNLYDNYKY